MVNTKRISVIEAMIGMIEAMIGMIETMIGMIEARNFKAPCLLPDDI